MADRPLSTPLPADLPENWTAGQTVAPSGADVGLSQQHGYNYLMEQVNAAQRAANAINESFDTISGKRTCRVTMGTSTAGWTQADCDYLCDGTDDREELNAAIAEVLAKGGGEIVVLGGEYFIAEKVNISKVRVSLSITGEVGATIFYLSAAELGGIDMGTADESVVVRLYGITFRKLNSDVRVSIGIKNGIIIIDSCIFQNMSIHRSYLVDDLIRFIFCNNHMEVDEASGLNGTNLQILGESNANFIISNNTFVVSDFVNTDLQIIYMYIQTDDNDADMSNAVFVGNTIETNGCLGRVSCSIEGPVVMTGNSFSWCNIDIRFTLFSNNFVSNGWVHAATGAVVSFNSIMLGHIQAWGESTVSGNFVKAPADQAAIIAYKVGLDVQEDASPCIVGNNIVAGSIGIYLRKDDWLPNTSISKALVCSNRIFGCTTPIQIDENWQECLVTNNLIPTGSSIVNYGKKNIVRLNSNDSGESEGGGTAGVASFNGRAGAVTPQTGDYTAAMVGARPNTWTPTAAEVGAVSAGSVAAMQVLTQTEYDALTTKDAATLYLIKE